MGNYIRTKQDLIWDLKEQIDFLKTSSELYDNGNYAEAKRLASTMRILLFDGGCNKSLLEQLKIKSLLRFHSVVETYDEEPLLLNGMIFRFNRGKVTNEPIFEPTIVKLLFQEWWDQPILIDKQKSLRLTRADAVTNAANKDGGAHVDPAIKGDYAKISRMGGMGWKQMDEEGIKKDLEPTPHLVVIRQTANELLKTFDEHLPQLLPDYQ